MKLKSTLIPLVLLFALVLFSGCVQPEVGVKDCEQDMECFGAEFKQCGLAKVVLSEAEEGVESSMYLESKGQENANCLLYIRLDKFAFPELPAEEEEAAQAIAEKLEALFTGLLGKDMTCAIPKDKLETVDVLESTQDMEAYCTGSLVTATAELEEKISAIMEEALEEAIAEELGEEVLEELPEEELGEEVAGEAEEEVGEGEEGAEAAGEEAGEAETEGTPEGEGTEGTEETGTTVE